MSKKTRRREKGLLDPKTPAPFRPSDKAYGVHALDATREEIMPKRKPLPVDQPNRRADHVLLGGPVVAYLEALIDAAMAHSGALNTDEDPELALCEATGMRHHEYEAVVLRTEGVAWHGIAKEQHVTPEAADAASNSGVRKLQRYVKT